MRLAYIYYTQFSSLTITDIFHSDKERINKSRNFDVDKFISLINA